MNTKSVLLSKTFWVQVATVLSLAVPQVRTWLDANPESFIAVLAAVNVIVRFLTSGKIVIFGAGETNGFLLAIAWFAIGTVAVATLSSCSAITGYPIKATVQLEEGALSYSSKGGLEMEYRPGFGQMPEIYRRGNK